MRIIRQLRTEDVLRVLKGVKKDGTGWTARCPAHEDHGRPNLHVTDNNGKALFKCFKGCNQDALAETIRWAIGTAQQTGIDFSKSLGKPHPAEKPGPSQVAFSMEKDVLPWTKLLEDSEDAKCFLESRHISMKAARTLHLGLHPNRYFAGTGCKPGCSSCGQGPALVIPTEWKGKILGVKYRALNPPDKNHKWSMEKGSSTRVLQYADLQKVNKSCSTVIVTEGPLDAAMLLSQGYNAVAIPSASCLPKTARDWPVFSQGLDALEATYRHIACVGDRTPEGIDAMQKLQALIGHGAVNHPVQSLNSKDVTEIIQCVGAAEFKRNVSLALQCVERSRPVPRHETANQQFRRIVGDLQKHCDSPNPVTTAKAPLSELRSMITESSTSVSDIPPFPEKAMVGLLGELAEVLTAGTLIPKHFVFMSLITILGLSVSGSLTYPNEDLNPRLYLCLIGERGRSKKSTATQRALDALSKIFGDDIIQLGCIGSGEALAQTFCNEDDKHHILLKVDELHSLTNKIGIEHASLGQKLLELYEANHISHFVKQEKVRCDNAHLTILTSTTPKGFEDAWTGTNGDEGGLLSRFSIEFAEPVTGKAFNLPRPDDTQLKPLVGQLQDYFDQLPLELGITSDAAAHLRTWWKERAENGTDARLDGFVKRIAMILAFTSGKTDIDIGIATAAIEIAERQSLLRSKFFPVDALNLVEKFEQRIVHALRKHQCLSQRELVQATNALRPGSGGMFNFNRALLELQKAGVVVSAGTNRKGKPMFALAEDETMSNAGQPSDYAVNAMDSVV